MPHRALIFGLAVTLLASGAACAGSRAAQGKQQGPKLQTEFTRIHARSRADRRKIRDLEHELTTLKRRLVERQAAALPPLPIEVRAPEEAEPPPASAAGPEVESTEELEEGEVVGIDDEGVEIVYAGDAARARSVQPRPLPRSYKKSRPARPASRARRAPSGASRPPARPPTIDAQMQAARQERLPITDRVGPTVKRWVDRGGDRGATRTPRLVARATPPPSGPSAPPSRPGRPQPAPPPARSAGELKAEYGRALDALRAGEHAAAIDSFRAFVARHPRHDLTDNAQYWLGEALYDQHLYRDALVEFRKVVDDFPHGNKVPDALLKIGYCHAALDEADEARAALELVMSMFPKSKPAALAARRIETLAEE